MNFVKGGAFNSLLFKQLCTYIDAAHHSLLLHTNVRRLSRGNITEQVFELRDEPGLFFKVQGRMKFFAWLNDEEWIVRLAYFVDIVEQLNKLNLLMQGRNTNIIKFVDALKAVMRKLENWRRKVNTINVAMFEKMSSILDVRGEDKVLPQLAKNEILQHLTALENEFSRYISELSDDELDLIRHPFKLSVEKVHAHCQDKFLWLKTDSRVRDMFDE